VLFQEILQFEVGGTWGIDADDFSFFVEEEKAWD